MGILTAVSAGVAHAGDGPRSEFEKHAKSAEQRAYIQDFRDAIVNAGYSLDGDSILSIENGEHTHQQGNTGFYDESTSYYVRTNHLICKVTDTSYSSSIGSGGGTSAVCAKRN